MNPNSNQNYSRSSFKNYDNQSYISKRSRNNSINYHSKDDMRKQIDEDRYETKYDKYDGGRSKNYKSKFILRIKNIQVLNTHSMMIMTITRTEGDTVEIMTSTSVREKNTKDQKIIEDIKITRTRENQVADQVHILIPMN